MRSLVSIGAFLLFPPSPLFAQEPLSLIPKTGFLDGGTCNFATGQMDFSCIPQYIGYLIAVLLAMAGTMFLVGIIKGGYKYALGSVTTEGKEAGKKQLMGAVMGFAVVVLSYLLIDTILEALL